MKKIFAGLVGVLLGFVLLFSTTGCNSVVAFSYVSYKLEGDQVAYHDSTVMPSPAHIFIFEDASKKPDITDSKYYDNGAQYRRDCSSNAIIEISFKRILGVEDVGDVRATLADVDRWYSVDVLVYKNNSIYDENKSVYINDKKMETTGKYDSVYDCEYFVKYHFEDHGLKRSNPHGKINDFVNIIEYK